LALFLHLHLFVDIALIKTKSPLYKTGTIAILNWAVLGRIYVYKRNSSG